MRLDSALASDCDSAYTCCARETCVNSVRRGFIPYSSTSPPTDRSRQEHHRRHAGHGVPRPKPHCTSWRRASEFSYISYFQRTDPFLLYNHSSDPVPCDIYTPALWGRWCTVPTKYSACTMHSLLLQGRGQWCTVTTPNRAREQTPQHCGDDELWCADVGSDTLIKLDSLRIGVTDYYP